MSASATDLRTRLGSTDTAKVPKTVLLAGGSITIQRVVELTLAEEDVIVVSVPDGDRAVDAITRSAPDLVLADVAMPGRNGYEVVEFVRSRPALAHLPVLLLAGAFELVDQTRAHLVGADGMLTKPFDPAVLLGRVHQLLTTGRGGPTELPPASLRRPWIAAAAPAASQAILVTAPLASQPAVEPDLPLFEPQAGAPVSGADSYFDQIDQAFASLSRTPRPRPSEADEELVSADEAPAQMSDAPAARARPLHLNDAFAAMLDAEHTGASGTPLMLGLLASPAAPAIDVNALADLVARRVLEQLSDRAIRESVSQIVSHTAERLVREEIDRIKRNIP